MCDRLRKISRPAGHPCDADVERHRDRVIAGIRRVVAQRAGSRLNRPRHRILRTSVEARHVVDDELAGIEDRLAPRNRKALRRRGVRPGVEQPERVRIEPRGRRQAGAGTAGRMPSGSLMPMQNSCRPSVRGPPRAPSWLRLPATRSRSWAVMRPSSKSTIARSSERDGLNMRTSAALRSA